MLDPDLQQPEVREECGVFGVWAPGEEVAKLTYFGLYALQHRGQEAAGIAVSDGSGVVVYKDLGLVAQVFDEPTLASLRGHLAIGHTRYSTTGGSTWENAQPTLRATPAGTTIALAHNGNLVNTAELAQQIRSAPAPDRVGPPDPGNAAAGAATSDTALVTSLLAGHPDLSVEEAALRVLPTLRGAFSFVFIDESTLYAARDGHGVRPLVLGRLERGWVVASETAALDIVGASVVREVEPGELLAVDEHGLRSARFANPTPAGCLFEYVYLARPDSTLAGRNVHAARVEIGRRLATEHPAEADLVIGVPESGIPAAIGYAEASGIPYGSGLIKNSYVGRTFIQPSQTIRQLGIRLKLNPLRENVRGKRLVVVDDSVVRGNTQRAIVRMLREAGAVEVHVRISSPPVSWPCFYGIDFATRAELIANGMAASGRSGAEPAVKRPLEGMAASGRSGAEPAVKRPLEGMAASGMTASGRSDTEPAVKRPPASIEIDGIRRSIGADTLGYVSLDGLVAATEQPKTRLCRACFDGEYPIALPAGHLIGKHVLEGTAASGRSEAKPAVKLPSEGTAASGRSEVAASGRSGAEPPVKRPSGASDRLVAANGPGVGGGDPGSAGNGLHLAAAQIPRGES